MHSSASEAARDEPGDGEAPAGSVAPAGAGSEGDHAEQQRQEGADRSDTTMNGIQAIETATMPRIIEASARPLRDGSARRQHRLAWRAGAAPSGST